MMLQSADKFFRFIIRIITIISISQVKAQADNGLATTVVEDTDCKCVDERGGCMIPVCPQGFYKCCFDCEVSTCAKEALGFWPDGLLTLSERGVMECLECKSGDYCSGCDVFQECPRDSSQFGSVGNSPKISPPGSWRERGCQRCPDGYEADIERDRCVPMFREACDIKLLELCMLGCKENPTNDECEKMACKLYCAKDQADTNPTCIAAFSDSCVEMNQPKEVAGDGTLILTTTVAPTLLFSDDSGIATVSPIPTTRACNLDCSSATSKTASLLLTFVALLGVNYATWHIM